MLSLSSRSILKRSLVTQRGAARFYSSTSTVHDNDPEVLEVEKQRNLTNRQRATSTPVSEAPGWNEYLATASEAHVKADKSKDSLVTLVSKTVEYVQSRYSPDERVGSREAMYERDSVEGPLGSTESPGPKIEVRTEGYEEVLENATPSEAAVKSDRGEV
ncbi:hypothetical protein BDM02DRAFT_3115023 [Thelephora ganbajun]|uniref:Uncharacterized protein n=1 Tax=Thelephora ganbajun TaxID=370292 RepID=A0ACB6ZGK0_THEGA|nr:hypothetical protein BDM02DRAFT_3115023 [Thelephora ganbajun]